MYGCRRPGAQAVEEVGRGGRERGRGGSCRGRPRVSGQVGEVGHGADPRAWPMDVSHRYQGARRDPVGIVKGRSSDRPLRGRRRGHTGVVSTRLPLQTRPFGAFATTGSFYSLRLPLRARSGRSDTVAVLLQARPRGGRQDGSWDIARYAAHDQYASWIPAERRARYASNEQYASTPMG